MLVFFYNRNMKSTNVLYATTLVYLSAKQSTIHWKPHLLQSCVTCVLTSFCWYCWEFWDQATSAKGRGLVGHNDCILSRCRFRVFRPMVCENVTLTERCSFSVTVSAWNDALTASPPQTMSWFRWSNSYQLQEDIIDTVNNISGSLYHQMVA